MKAPWIFLIIVLLLAGSAAISVLRARARYGEVLQTTAQFEQLKPGDRIVYVCRQCEGEREIALTSVAAAMEHSREGATLICPGCNHKMTVMLKRPSGSSGLPINIRYVDKKGPECLTIAKALPGK